MAAESLLPTDPVTGLLAGEIQITFKPYFIFNIPVPVPELRLESVETATQ
jgi:hypothetical protein